MQTKMNEIGRSMIEILGVLAIVGVLSVGAVAGYRYAMDKYRANDIVYEVNMRATDVWHRFQDKPLPALGDATAFSEWNNTTQTGYPITISPFPDVAFKIGVQNVSSRVCKNVMTMNLHQIIEGFQFAQINGAKYLGDASLCGNDETINEIVFTSFLDSQDPNTQHCVEDSDCHSKCAEKVCNGETMTCDDQCPEWSKPVRLEETCECVECVKNSDCKFKGEGYICDETTYTCSALQKVCPAGTFRTQNGACVACDNGSNFIVLKNGEPFPNTEDTVDGYTMCQQCASDSAGDKKYNRKYGLLEDGNAYCDYMCTNGRSYQSSDEGCIPCSDDSWHYLSSDDVSVSQCLACNNHEWYSICYSKKWCQKKLECAEDEYITLGTPFACSKCSENRNEKVKIIWCSKSSESTTYSKELENMCNNCSSPNKRYYFQEHCYPLCEQPEDVESCTDPYNCSRKWQNGNGACLSCDDDTANNAIFHDSAYEHWTHESWPKLCTACGRIVKDGYCLLPKKEGCKVGQFLGADGNCYECNNEKGIIITSEEDSGCVTNCRKTSSDATDYNVDGTVETRRTYMYGTYTGAGDSLFCAPKCPQNYINNDSGKCVSCGNNNSTSAFLVAVSSECNVQCSNRQSYGQYCGIKNCPTAQKYYKKSTGSCVLCSNNTVLDSIYSSDTSLCNACVNRMAYSINNNQKCSLIIPGEYGVCNSLWSNEFPADLDDNLISKAQPYLNGEYDGEKFLADDGYCRNCMDETSYSSSKEQCLSCPNRRYQNGTCAFGLCDTNFYLSMGTCVSCSNVNKPIDPSKENLCSSCSDRRQLEIGTPNTTWSGLCVEECAGTQWQDINGNCLFCSEGGTREIGTDAESRRLCNECDGLREEQAIYGTDGTTVIGYKCVLKTTE